MVHVWNKELQITSLSRIYCVRINTYTINIINVFSSNYKHEIINTKYIYIRVIVIITLFKFPFNTGFSSFLSEIRSSTFKLLEHRLECIRLCETAFQKEADQISFLILLSKVFYSQKSSLKFGFSINQQIDSK